MCPVPLYLLWNRLATPQDTHEATLLLRTTKRSSRESIVLGKEKQTTMNDGEAPSATARFYSNGRNSYSCLVPCARRPSKMQAALLPCSVHFVDALSLSSTPLLWSLRVVKRSYKLSKPSGTTCSFRRKLRQLTKLLVRINLHRGYPTITQLVFWLSAERDSTAGWVDGGR